MVAPYSVVLVKFPDEVAELLDHVETGQELTKHQQAFHEKTKVRDLALMTLLLGTGIRVSECVGLNINDVDFKNSCISIFRKGGKESMVYFGDEVEEALLDYLEERKMSKRTECVTYFVNAGESSENKRDKLNKLSKK